MKKLVITCMFASIALLSCKKKSDVTPDDATTISGTYEITSYVTQASSSGGAFPSANNLVITKNENENVSVTLQYPSSSGIPDVLIRDMVIVKSGNNYNLSETFIIETITEAVATATISGNTFTFSLKYTDGSYLNITATK